MRWILVVSAFLAWAVPATANIATEWNGIALDAIRRNRLPPPRASRLLAMVHVSMHDAWTTLHGRRAPYMTHGRPLRGAMRRCAAVAAAHRVLSAELPGDAARFDAILGDILRTFRGRRIPASLAWGRAVADDVLAWRAGDGSTIVVPYTPKTAPGFWQPTPPAFAAALLPNWPAVTPWAMSSGEQFRAPLPPALASAEYTAAFAEVAALGRKTGSTRTEEQTEIARFWDDGPGSATPPGHWNMIANALVETERPTTAESLRLLALLNMALADAAISAWDTKYAYEHWRPVTGIRAAADDGNDATAPDATWESLIITPPFPAYTSGHSTFSAAGARLLARFFGTDDVAFVTTSDLLPGVTRSFERLSDAAAEAGQSRIYGGIHWQYDNREGLAAGRAIGDRVFDTRLR